MADDQDVAPKLPRSPLCLGVSGVLLAVPSAFYWAWFDTATFRSTLLLDAGLDLYSAYLVVTLLAGAAALLAAYFKRDAVYPKLALGPYGAILAAFASCCGLLVIFASRLALPVLVLVTGACMGVCCSYFLLEWARLYSHYGARSAGPLMALSVAMGVGVDLLISNFAPVPAAVFTALLPLVASALLWFFDAVVRYMSKGQNSLGTRGPDDLPFPAPRTAEPFDSDRSLEAFLAPGRHVLGLPLGLFLSFGVFGVSFGLTVFLSASQATGAAVGPFDALLFVRGGTALLVFVLTQLFPRRLYAILKAGMFVGLAGFVVSPVLGAVVGASQLVSSCVTVVGYTAFDIMTWSVLAEASRLKGVHTVELFSPGRCAVHTGVALGYLAGAVLAAAGLLADFGGVAQTTVGYLLAIASTTFVGARSVLEVIPRTVEPLADARAATLAELAEKGGLTQREAEILEQLAAGRSRPRIAESLGISENTVGSHIRHIYEKLDIHSTQEAIDLLSAQPAQNTR
jgi:DNA-binding CsgD family transcriptional regulator